jgi:hypothetical protein
MTGSKGLPRKRSAIASFLKYKKIRQFPYEDRLVPRLYDEQISLPGLDLTFGKNNPSTAKNLGKKVTV